MTRDASLAEVFLLAQLAWLAEELTSLRGRVLAQRDRLPAAGSEATEEDTTCPDPWSELRSILSCIVADRLTPAIEDLLAATRLIMEMPNDPGGAA